MKEKKPYGSITKLYPNKKERVRYYNSLRKGRYKKAQHEKDKLKHPDKFKAWKNDYRKRGKLCKICGSKNNLEFHHIDYITHEGFTLCNSCHRQQHKT